MQKLLLILTLFVFDKNISGETKVKGNFNKINSSLTLPASSDTIYLINEVFGKKVSFYNTTDPFKYNVPFILGRSDIENEKRIASKDTLVLLESKTFTPFVVIPGESLTIKKDDNDRIFLEKKGDSTRNNELRFFYEWRKVTQLPRIPSMKAHNKESYKVIQSYYKEFYTKGLTFLNNYKTSHPISDGLSNYFRRYLYDTYLTFLLNPVLYSDINSLEGELEGYKKHFTADYELSSDSYKKAAYNYSVLLTKLYSGTNDFSNHFNIIKQNFSGGTRKYLLYRVLVNHIEEGISGNKFQESYNDFVGNYTNDTLSRLLESNYNYILNTSAILEKQEYFNEEVISVTGERISWKKIIDHNKGKVIYMDFWAGWCIPCIQALPFSFALREEINSQDLVFLYFSSDVGKMTWLSNLSRLKFPGVENTYLIVQPSESKLMEFLRIKSIPRYILINKKGEIVNRNAPAPKKSQTKQMIQRLLEEKVF